MPLYENKMSTTFACHGCKQWIDKVGCKQKKDFKECEKDHCHTERKKLK
jgi:hypothetical protein